jgi:hypothetical protein
MLSYAVNISAALVICLILIYNGYKLCNNLPMILIPILVVNAMHSITEKPTDLDVVVFSATDGPQRVSINSNGTLKL